MAVLAWIVGGAVAAGILAVVVAVQSHGGLMLAPRPSARHVAALRRGMKVPGRYLWHIRPRRRRRIRDASQRRAG